MDCRSFFSVERKIEDGDVDEAFATSEYTLEGTTRMGGQEHFYLETQACIVIPKGEDGEVEIVASTQGLKETQIQAALALGVSANKVVARVKRIGKLSLIIRLECLLELYYILCRLKSSRKSSLL